MTANKKNIVMLVDDSSIDIYINTKILEQSKLAKQIIVKESGQEALNFLKDNSNEESKIPNLLLLDLNMPGLDGFDFLDEFKKMNDLVKKKVKIVVLTSSDKTEDIHSSINNPLVRRYLIKPLTEESILDIQKMLN